MRNAIALLAGLTLFACAVACGGSSNDPTPTPAATCVEVAEGVCAHTMPIPPLPSGATQLSAYYLFDTTEDTGVVIGIPLTATQNSDSIAGFYTYSPIAGWMGVISAISLEQNGTVLQGAFPHVPTNVAVLLWPGDPTRQQ